MKRKRLTRRDGPGLPIIPRIFAVAAAVLLVGSVALASLLPADISLAQAIHGVDERGVERLRHLFLGDFGRALWSALVDPILVRPVWLVPVSLGLICIGGTLTALSHASPHTKQRRS